MKHIIILGDGMSDHPVDRLGGKTLLEYANTPAFDFLARNGQNGCLVTIPATLEPGSEVANASIMGYDIARLYEGRGPLEAASIGYEMAPDEMAMRCNLLTLSDDGLIQNHNGGHLKSEEGAMLVDFLNEKLGDERVKFVAGTQYRQLLIIKGGDKRIECAPPHDHPNEPWRQLLVKPLVEEARPTAELINELILKSQELLSQHPINEGRDVKVNSIWPWSPGYRPAMEPLSSMFAQINSGAVISAVDLIKGLGIYAGLRVIEVEGATGLPNTNYAGKAQAAIEALKTDDFVYLHVEAPDEAGHDGDLQEKLYAIEMIDSQVVAPIIEAVKGMGEDVAIALLPDHATPVEERVHRGEPVPFAIWHKGIQADSVETYSEKTCAEGCHGTLYLTEFMKKFLTV